MTFMRLGTASCIAALVVAAGGCTAHLNAYRSLAEAGQVYAAATDELYQRSLEAAIDANSEALLATKTPDMTAADLAPVYLEADANMEQRVSLITDLQAHARLIRDYFEALNGLASSDAPAEAEAAAESIAKDLAVVGSRIALRLPPIPPDVFGQAALRTFTAIQLAALRQEIKARYEVIDRELVIQEKALGFLADRIRNDLGFDLAGRYERDVTDVYLKPGRVTNPARWKNTRRELLTAGAVLAEVGQVQYSVAAIRVAWRNAADGRLTHDDLVSAISDLRSFVVTLQGLKAALESD